MRYPRRATRARDGVGGASPYGATRKTRKHGADKPPQWGEVLPENPERYREYFHPPVRITVSKKWKGATPPARVDGAYIRLSRHAACTGTTRRYRAVRPSGGAVGMEGTSGFRGAPSKTAYPKVPCSSGRRTRYRCDPISSEGAVSPIRADAIARAGAFGGASPIRSVGRSIADATDSETHPHPP